MTWLQRLKNLNSPSTDATKPTKAGSVGFVAYPQGHIEKIKAVNDAKNDATLQRLLTAAMRACDRWSDGVEGREAMRRDVLETPPEDRAALLAHFAKNYPKEAE